MSRDETLAEKFVRLWHDPTRSIQARTLVMRLDRAAIHTRVNITRWTFSDGSEVFSSGSRGRWLISEKDPHE